MSEIASYLEKVIGSHLDDIILTTLGLFCISIGRHYRKIASHAKKEIFGNVLGLLIIIIVSRSNFLHIFFCFAVCGGIILLHKKIQCHVFVCIFMFLYLWFFREIDYFFLPTPPHQRHTHFVQLILSLKLVGLAFEVNDATLKCGKASKEAYEQIPYHEKELAEITLRNIFGYCFSYIGNTGLYLTYRTYRDSIVEKYSSDEKLAEACERNVAEKLKLFLILTFLYFLSIYLWLLERMFEDEFYAEQSFLFRVWYIWIAFIIFRIKMYNIMIMCNCITSASGLGAYPTVFQSIPGGGPKTKDPQLLDAWDGTYDFNTIKNFDIYNVEARLTFREAIKAWNMCVQYWLVMNVYKRFPIRKLRAVATVVVSAFWHGNNLGYHFCIVLSVFYIAIEDLCLKRLRSSFPVFPFWLKGCIWFLKFLAFSYLAIPFQLVLFSRFWRYYSSVYHFGYVVFACQFAVAFFWPKISTILLRRKDLIGPNSK